MCRSTNNGDSFTAITAVAGGGLTFIGGHPTSVPEAVIALDRISRDDGLTWPIVFSGRVESMSRAGVAYIIRGNNDEVHRSTNWHTATTSNGVGITPFWQAPVSLQKYGLTSCIIRASWASEGTIWAAKNATLYRVTNDGGVFTSAVVTTFNLASLLSDAGDPTIVVSDIAPDPNDASIVYVSTRGTGGNPLWRLRISGSTATAENITLNAQRWPEWSVSLLTDTSDLIISGGPGTHGLARPTTHALSSPASRWSTWTNPVKIPVTS
jgi:hypothetical protein